MEQFHLILIHLFVGNNDYENLYLFYILQFEYIHHSSFIDSYIHSFIHHSLIHSFIRHFSGTRTMRTCTATTLCSSTPSRRRSSTPSTTETTTCTLEHPQDQVKTSLFSCNLFSLLTIFLSLCPLNYFFLVSCLIFLSVFLYVQLFHDSFFNTY